MTIISWWDIGIFFLIAQISSKLSAALTLQCSRAKTDSCDPKAGKGNPKVRKDALSIPCPFNSAPERWLAKPANKICVNVTKMRAVCSVIVRHKLLDRTSLPRRYAFFLAPHNSDPFRITRHPSSVPKCYAHTRRGKTGLPAEDMFRLCYKGVTKRGVVWFEIGTIR